MNTNRWMLLPLSSLQAPIASQLSSAPPPAWRSEPSVVSCRFELSSWLDCSWIDSTHIFESNTYLAFPTVTCLIEILKWLITYLSSRSLDLPLPCHSPLRVWVNECWPLGKQKGVTSWPATRTVKFQFLIENISISKQIHLLMMIDSYFGNIIQLLS